MKYWEFMMQPNHPIRNWKIFIVYKKTYVVTNDAIKLGHILTIKDEKLVSHTELEIEVNYGAGYQSLLWLQENFE